MSFEKAKSNKNIDAQQKNFWQQTFSNIRHISGFESAVLKFPQKPGKIYPIAPVAFVTFKSKADAQVAKEKLQGDKFDEDYPTTLRLEFAKSNTKNRMKSIKELDTSQIPMFVPGKYVKKI